jgi:hypothetical protein
MVELYLIKKVTSSSRLIRLLRTRRLLWSKKFVQAIHRLVRANFVSDTIQIAIAVTEVAVVVVGEAVLEEVGPVEVSSSTPVVEALAGTMMDRIANTKPVDKEAQADSSSTRAAATIVNNLIITGMVLIAVGEKEATETIITAVVKMTGKAATPANRTIATLETETLTASKITDRLLIVALVSIRRVTGPMATTTKIKDLTTCKVGLRTTTMDIPGRRRLLEEDTEVGIRNIMVLMEAMDITDLVTKEVIMDLPTRFQASRPKRTTDPAAKIVNARTTNINSQTRLLVGMIKDNIKDKLATRTLT